MSTSSELGHLAMPNIFLAQRENQIAQANFELGTSRSRVLRSAVASHWPVDSVDTRKKPQALHEKLRSSLRLDLTIFSRFHTPVFDFLEYSQYFADQEIGKFMTLQYLI